MEILNREVSIQEDKYIILEQVKKTYTRNELLNEIQNIQRQKAYLAEQSRRFKFEYDSLHLKEVELQGLLNTNDFEEIVE